MPISGRYLDSFLPATVLFMRKVSPGNTGFIQRSSSMPGEPKPAESAGILSTVMRMAMAPVCQPLAHRPPKIIALPASSDK